jgi:hypothetical protein
MARMSREFTLVLLGAGLLTAGYFLWPEEDPVKKAEQEAARGGRQGGRTYTRVTIIPIITHTGPGSSARPSVVRGGFGRTGFFGGG